MSETHLKTRPDEHPPAPSTVELAVDHFVLREDLRRSSVPIDQFGSWRWHKLSFALFVVLPTLCASIYYGLIASDLYAVEFRFSVRSASDLVAEQDIVSMLARGGGLANIGRLPYMAASYLRSRNAVRELDADISLREIYSRPEADWFARLNPSRNDDVLWAYWQSMMAVNVDRVSGLVLVRVLAFTPDDALTLARTAAEAIDRMVDGVATTARRDALAIAEDELKRAAERYAAALTQLRELRNREGTVDPKQTIEDAVATLVGVMRDKLALERQRDTNARSLALDSPQQKILASQIRALESQIAAQAEALTSKRQDMKTAADTIARFEERELERRFAERLLEAAQATYEKARQESERQHIYTTPFVPPKKPEIAEYPRRARSIAFVALSSLGLWGVFTLIIAGIRDHKNMH
jgi:capsular polysaccharide transport system permease protein